MKSIRTLTMGMTTAAALMAGQAMADSVIFADDFNSEVVSNNASLTNFTVENTVAVVSNGGNKYVNMQGSAASKIELDGGLSLEAGDYTLSFDIASTSGTSTVHVRFGFAGSDYVQTFNVASGSFVSQVMNLTLPTDMAGVRVVFANVSGTRGPLLDNVVVSRIGGDAIEDTQIKPIESAHMPSPTAVTAGMLLLGAMGLKRRRLA